MTPRTTEWREVVLRTLRQRWIAGAVLAVGIEFAGFWLLSPSSQPRWRPRPSEPVPPPAGESSRRELERLLQLWTPALPLMAGLDDFSAQAWMHPEGAQVQVEAFAVPERRLPFVPAGSGDDSILVRSAGSESVAGAWTESGRWAASTAVQPRSTALAVDSTIRWRVLENAGKWRIAAPNGPAGAAFPKVAGDAGFSPLPVVRLVLDPKGESVAPPLVWESSGQAALDAAALAVAGRWKWVCGGDGSSVGGATTRDERTWVLVAFERGGVPVP